MKIRARVYIFIFIAALFIFYRISSIDKKELTLNIEQNYKTQQKIVDIWPLKKDETILKIDKYNYSKHYPYLKSCKTNYKPLQSNSSEFNYSAPVSYLYHKHRIVRAVLLYFPADKSEHFFIEFKWFYRSWIEMIKYEPPKWRTDIIVFLDTSLSNETLSKFNELNCNITNTRKSKEDAHMCTLIDFKDIKDRNFDKTSIKFNETYTIYEYILNEIDIFNDDLINLLPFYNKLKELSHYNYVNSILIAFEGYRRFKDSYDFLLRSDIDVFLTPLFARWLPRFCNTFYVGGGGYSHDFNMKRLSKAAKNLYLGFANKRNLGSTWYSTPHQFRLVSFLTLFSMAYLSAEEFSQTEREGKVGTILWPEWHYGVLLLYGQNLAMNHLIATKQANIKMLNDLIDYPSANNHSVFSKVHIHVFHGADVFSKFQFRSNVYDGMQVKEEDRDKISMYCLHLALESKKLSGEQMRQLLSTEIANKI